MSEELPTQCQCGGNLVYDFAFDWTFVHCDKCTPKVEFKIKQFTWENLDRVQVIRHEGS